MKITKAVLSKQLPEGATVSQLGSKQLFIVDHENCKVLYSYREPIGFMINGAWSFNDEFFSFTTSRHLAYFIKESSKEYHKSSPYLFRTALWENARWSLWGY